VREQNLSTADANWFESAFDALYPVVYAHRTVEAAVEEAHFAARQTGLRGDETVLDLCCGNGRHLGHLSGVTSRAVGLDYSADLLCVARHALGSRARLVRGDMRSLPFTSCFDVVFNFFTSFGYFQEEADNVEVARQLARALKPGGRFFMDYLNPARVEATLVPHSQREQDGFLIHEERWIDRAARRVNKTTLVTRDEEVVTRAAESVRLYPREELVALLGGCGLEVARAFGGYGGDPFNARSERMILVGRRAA
jgi:SAM-dependent methyltransferase